MPHLDAAALTSDPEGADFLRRVLDNGEPMVTPSRSAFIPTQATSPAAPAQRERPAGRPLMAIADAA